MILPISLYSDQFSTRKPGEKIVKRFLWLIAFTIAVSSVSAEPHYSALFGQSCHLCHAGATGKGMRSLYGSQFFGPTYLPFKPVSFDLLEKVKPKLSESVSIGADLRTIWLSENTQIDTVEAGLSAPLSTNTGSMTQMEGYLYFALQPTDEVLLYFSQGISPSRFEAYGQANILPWRGFVKAGQFQENFGWAFADHTSFVRTGLFGNYNGTTTSTPDPPGYGVGGEIGFHPKYFDVTASFTNSSGAIPGARDTQKRWFARAQAQHGIESLGLQFTVGGSWFLAPKKFTDPEYAFLFEQQRNEGWGGFGGIGWQGLQDRLGCRGGFGFLTTAMMFEYDRKAWSPGINELAQPIYQTSAYSTTQIAIMIQPGIWLNGAYDWLDNGTPQATDPEAERTTLGLQIFPLPWIEIAPRYRLYSLSGVSLRNKQQMELQAHFFF